MQGEFGEQDECSSESFNVSYISWEQAIYRPQIHSGNVVSIRNSYSLLVVFDKMHYSLGVVEPPGCTAALELDLRVRSQ